MAFVKLFSSITESSLWSETKDTRLLFVTMLAKADADGFVEASLPGLARVANLSIDETRVALDVLLSPDEHSKNPEFDGRRIAKISGGWCVLNYAAYRERRDDEERRAYMRQFMRDRRAAERERVNNVSNCKPPLAKGEAEADSEAKPAAAPIVSNPRTQAHARAQKQPKQPSPSMESNATDGKPSVAPPLSGSCTTPNDRPSNGQADGSPSIMARIDRVQPEDIQAPDMFDGMQEAPLPVPRKNFADWHTTMARDIFTSREDREGWVALFDREGWDEMSKGIAIARRRRKPGSKYVFLSDMLPIMIPADQHANGANHASP